MPGKSITIATWNINSVRLRAGLVARLRGRRRSRMSSACKRSNARMIEFPAKAFKAMGLRHLHVVGQKGWHGVAIVSRLPLEPVNAPAALPHERSAHRQR